MTKDNLFHCGHISKTTGIKGALVLIRENIDEEMLFEQEALFVDLTPDYVPFMISSLEAIAKTNYHVLFEDVRTPEEAERLSGRAVFIPRNRIGDEDLHSYKGVKGFRVVDEEHGVLGVIIDIRENPAHELLVMDYQDQEVLIPVAETIITGVDTEQNEIYTHLPEGLLDLNADN